MKKRVLSIIFALTMLLPMFTVGTFALTPEEEAKQCMRDVLTVFVSGTFAINARSSSSFEGNEMVPVTIALNDNRMAFETTMDWESMFRSGSNGNMAIIQAATAGFIFGKKLRIVTKTDDITFVFPDRKMYLPMADIVPEGEEVPEFDLAGAMGGIFNDTSSIEEQLNEITSSKETLNGKEYLCAEISTEGSELCYYFLNGKLKRIEAMAGEEIVTWEDITLSPTVDESFFSTACMWKMPLSLISSIGHMTMI